MLRLFVLMSLVAMISSFSVNMCEVPQVDSRPQVDGRKVVPIVCEPGLRKSDVSKENLRKMVYEATFEEDRIVNRPMRRRRRRSYVKKLTQKTWDLWYELKENVRRIMVNFFMS